MMPLRPRKPYLLALVTALLGVLALYQYWPDQPLPPGAVADKVLVIKSARELQLLGGNQVLKTYRIALGRNPKGGKTHQGDARTPEGSYRIDWRNPQSRFHLSLHISYPSAQDRKRARALGKSPGGDIMIHGMANGYGWIGRFHRWVDWTSGCIAVTDDEIEEIWRAVPNGTPIEIRA
jgi:murein L,D-transpeptidase YafK